MNEIPLATPFDLLQAYSRAEMTRREIAARLGGEVSFGWLLAQLHAYGLPLPRVGGNPQSEGVRLIAALATRQRSGSRI